LTRAGYLNPRLLVSAHQKIAVNHGCQLIPEVVEHIVREGGGFILKLTSGQAIATKKILIASGIYTGHTIFEKYI
jgi:thioredoxin reductase